MSEIANMQIWVLVSIVVVGIVFVLKVILLRTRGGIPADRWVWLVVAVLLVMGLAAGVTWFILRSGGQ